MDDESILYWLMLVTIYINYCHSFRIGAFNVQTFGIKKASDPAILPVLAKVVYLIIF